MNLKLKSRILRLFLAFACLCDSGCSRRWYRLQADRDAEALVSERVAPEFQLGDRAVAPSPMSRMADLANPDCGPLPPDDSHSARYMSHPYKARGAKVWQKRGSLESVEFHHWEQFLPKDQTGAIRLNRLKSMELALLHGRSYQTAVEDVYLRSLSVALERFSFDTQWTGTAGLLSTRHGTGRPPFGSRTLRLSDSLGAHQRFATGGQLLADFSNAMVWEFTGGRMSTGSVLSFQFLQPLMRGAFREVQLERLTQAERNLLYQIRDFARFRQSFYIDTVGNNGYLGLLELAQAIRNQESNLASLKRNLDEHTALAAAGQVSQFQVDQVFQDFEQGRQSLQSAQLLYESALDAFEIQMGLPPMIETELDFADLEQFQLSNPVLDDLSGRNETVRISLLQFDEAVVPTLPQLTDAQTLLSTLLSELRPILTELDQELEAWLKKLERETAESTTQNGSDDERAELERRGQLADRLSATLIELTSDADRTARELAEAQADIAASEIQKAFSLLSSLSGETLRQLIADVFVVQTQVRVYLVDVSPVEIPEARARWIAEQNRLDLRNELARVVDAYRHTEVAADLLEADLDLRLRADLATDSNRRNPVRFDASASTLSAGLEFDGPLNRMAERNVWRSSQIDYQRARREYMATCDNIAFEVRNNLRILSRERFQFEITRQQLITAARQVEQAQLNLRSSTEPNSNLTRDLLSALQTLLRTRNTLISSWVTYETSRMELYRSMGVLYVDDTGAWINDGETFSDLLDSDPDPFGAGSATTDTEAPILGLDTADPALRGNPVRDSAGAERSSAH